MDAHRRWLIETYGSVCAYCGTEIAEERTTLDHVYPRKGKTAYDRPDNLVLACQPCNAAKADTSFVAFIAQKRSRGVFLLEYGDHLSDWVKDLIRETAAREFLPPDRPRFVAPNGNGEGVTAGATSSDRLPHSSRPPRSHRPGHTPAPRHR